MANINNKVKIIKNSVLWNFPLLSFPCKPRKHVCFDSNWQTLWKENFTWVINDTGKNAKPHQLTSGWLYQGWEECEGLKTTVKRHTPFTVKWQPWDNTTRCQISRNKSTVCSLYKHQRWSLKVTRCSGKLVTWKP